MNNISTALVATLFCMSAGFAHAQAPSGDMGKGPMGGPGGHRMKPCSEEADPAKCEANRKQMRENMKAAREACKDSKDKRACMTQSFCAKQPDPAKCQERAKQHQAKMGKHMDEHQAMAEACTGKRGDALQSCMKEQWAKKHPKSDKKG
ncbi:MAG: periplasmic heavy metal sensor [Burkholderiales bacterium]